MKNQFKKQNLVLIVLLTLLFLLTACSSATSEDSNDENTALTTSTIETTLEEIETTTIVENVPNNEMTTVTEDTTGSESTPENEVYIPEGIDINSTLSGQEWLESFIGNVNEPVVVVFSDDTGRKEVVQANSEIEINPDEDTIAVYWPEEGMRTTYHAISLAYTTRFNFYEINDLDAVSLRSIPERPARITVRGNDKEDWVIEFTILVK